MSKEKNIQPTRISAAETAGSDALAKQTAESRNPKPDVKKDVVAPRYDRAIARRDNADTARKREAKKTGSHLFPEVKPQNGQVVLAIKSNRVGSPMFMAEYRQTTPTSPDGAFYSNPGGTYSMLEGTVDSWMELPGE